jgi:hypothetical protein
MIGYLPRHLTVNGVDRAIRSDFRTALLIFQAYNDPEEIENDYIHDKTEIMLHCLYEDCEGIPQEDVIEAIDKGRWFLNGGGTVDSNSNQSKAKKTMDWEQDEQIMFAAVNKVAGYEVRATEYLHWWTFLGFFNEIGEGLFSSVLNIRNKLNKKKKLDKGEQEFYRENKSLIDIKPRYTAEEQAEIDRLNNLLPN